VCIATAFSLRGFSSPSPKALKNWGLSLKNKKKRMAFGFWAYVAGLVISLALGFSGLEFIFSLIILAALGLIVGFLNFGGDSEHLFALFTLTIVFWIMHYLSGIFSVAGAGSDLSSAIFSNLLLFSIAATTVLAFKNFYDSSHSPSASRISTGPRQNPKARRVA